MRDTGYLAFKTAVLDDCLDPLLRSSAWQFANETVQLFDRPRDHELVIVGTGTVRVLSRLWRTLPQRAVHFLWDYATVLTDARPSITWKQVEDAL